MHQAGPRRISPTAPEISHHRYRRLPCARRKRPRRLRDRTRLADPILRDSRCAEDSEAEPSMSRYQTRPAEQGDEPFLYACYKQTMREYIDKTWGWHEEFQRASFAEHLPWQRFQIITIDRIPVGGACILDSPSCIDLEMIIINPQFQRMGIGTDFIGSLLRRARKGRRPVRLRVMKVNPARALYQRLGFIDVGEDAGTIEMRAGL